MKKEQVTMDIEDLLDSVTLVGCEDEECGGLSFEQELEENGWKCIHCGEPILKPD
jgi:hypothetical protein